MLRGPEGLWRAALSDTDPNQPNQPGEPGQSSQPSTGEEEISLDGSSNGGPPAEASFGEAPEGGSPELRAVQAKATLLAAQLEESFARARDTQAKLKDEHD